MSLSGLSASRKSSWAMMMLETSSLIGGPEEHDPVHQEPGEDVVGPLAPAGALDDVRRIERGHRQDCRLFDGGLLKQEVERLLLGDAALQLGQAVRLLERAVELAGRDAARLGHGGDARVDLRLGGAEPLLLDQGVEDQIPLDLGLGDLVELLLERRAAAPAGSGTPRRSRASAGAPGTRAPGCRWPRPPGRSGPAAPGHRRRARRRARGPGGPRPGARRGSRSRPSPGPRRRRAAAAPGASPRAG